MSRKLLSSFLAAVRKLELVEIIGIDPTRRHPHLLFRLHGRTYRHAIPGTPSDHRSFENSVNRLRRRIRQLLAENPELHRD